MAITINWQFQAAIDGGLSIAVTQPTISIGGYDVTQIKVTAGAVGLTIPIQPAAALGEVVFLTVTSSLYDPTLTYTVSGVVPAVPHALDGPHILLGSGAVSFLDGAQSPTALSFTNGTAKDANVQIVVGRKVP